MIHETAQLTAAAKDSKPNQTIILEFEEGTLFRLRIGCLVVEFKDVPKTQNVLSLEKAPLELPSQGG